MSFNLLILNADKSTGTNFARSLSIAKGGGWGKDIRTFGAMGHPVRSQLSPVDVPIFEQPEDLIEFVARLEKNLGEPIDLVYETKSAEYMVQLSKARDQLPVFLPPHSLLELFEDKLATQQVLQKNGFAVPRSAPVNSAEDVRNFFRSRNKPNSSAEFRAWFRETAGQGGRGSFFTGSSEEAVRKLQECNGWGNYMVAEMLPVDIIRDWELTLSDDLYPGDMVTWSALYENGRLVGSQVRKRLYWEHSELTPSGVTGYSGGQLVLNNRNVHDLSDKIVRSFEWEPSGPIGIDFVVGPDGVPNVTEIQACRFYTSMSSLATLGLNLPKMYIDVYRGVNRIFDLINTCEPGAVVVQRFGAATVSDRDKIIQEIRRSRNLMADRQGSREKEINMNNTPVKGPIDRVAEDYLRLTGRIVANAQVIHDGRQNTVLLVADASGEQTIARYRTAKEFWYEDCVKEPLLEGATPVLIPEVIGFDDEQRPQVLISEFVEGDLLADTEIDPQTAEKVGKALAQIHVPTGKSTNFLDFVGGKESQSTWKADFSASFIDTALDCGFSRSDAQSVLSRCAGSMDAAENQLVLLHNDFHFKNMIRTEAGEISILDWDSASVGPREKDFGKLLDWSHDNVAIVENIIEAYQAEVGVELDPDLIEMFRVFSDLRQISFQKKVAEAGVSDQAITQGGFFASNSERFETLNAALGRLGLKPWEASVDIGNRNI